MNEELHMDEHGNYNPKCPFCGARECESHLVLDYDPCEGVSHRSLFDDQHALMKKIASEAARVALVEMPFDDKMHGPLSELVNATEFAVDEDGEVLIEEFEGSLARYLIETARTIACCQVEEHFFDGGSPGSASNFYRLYLKDKAEGYAAIAAAIERDINTMKLIN